MLLRDAVIGDVLVLDDTRVSNFHKSLLYQVSEKNTKGIRLVTSVYGIPSWYNLDSDLSCIKTN